MHYLIQVIIAAAIALGVNPQMPVRLPAHNTISLLGY